MFHHRLVQITEDQVRSVLRMEQLIPAVRQALIDFSRRPSSVTQPVRSILQIPQHSGWFGVMPVVYGDLMGAKMVTFYPGNASGKLPTHQAAIQLFSSATGEPLATMDGRLITEMRTAAVSAVATALLAPADAEVLAILGSGVQARSHLHALKMVRGFTEVRVWSPTARNAKLLADETGALAMPSAEAAARDADVVITVTSASEPILLGRWLKPNTYVNAVGAVGPSRRELDDEVMRATVVVESRDSAMRESGDILLSGANVHAEVGELLARPDAVPKGRLVFKSLGIAVEDIVAARLVYEALSDVQATTTIVQSR